MKKILALVLFALMAACSQNELVEKKGKNSHEPFFTTASSNFS